MDQDSVHMVAASKVTMLKPGEYELWRIRMEQYIQMVDYSLWEVIENGNAPLITKLVEGVETIVAPSTTKEKAQRRLELKARSTLLIGIPNENQLNFNSIKDAKSLLQAVEKRFGGNTATKKTQRNLLKQRYENFTPTSSEVLDQVFDRLQKLISQLEIHGESISQEDIYEPKVKGTSSSSTNTQNIAFVSSNNISSTNGAVNTAHGVTTASTQAIVVNSTTIDNLKMDLRWQMAMLTMRARRFLKNTGRKLTVNGTKTIGFDKSKGKHKKCVSGNTTFNALISCDGLGDYDWSDQAKEGPTNFALMAYSSKSSNSEVSTDSNCSSSCLENVKILKEKNEQLLKDLRTSKINAITYKTGLESVEARLLVYKKNEFVYEEDIKLLKCEIYLKDVAITELRRKLEHAQKQKDKIQLTVEKLENSSKSLSKLIDYQIVDKCKTDDRYAVSNGSGYAVLISWNGYAVLDRKLDTPVWKSVRYVYSMVGLSGVLEFLGVGTTFDIFQNIHILYLEYGVLSLSSYGVLSFIHCGLWWHRKFNNGLLSQKQGIELPDDPNMPELEDIVYSDDYEDVSAEADMNNLNTLIPVSPIPTARIHKDYLVEQIIGDLNSAPQTRRMTNNLEEHEEPKKGIHTLKDPSWIEAMQDELLQFKLQKMDVKSAFLYGKIEEEVYVCQPPGFEDPNFPDRVYKVENALYGLHQAPRAWTASEAEGRWDFYQSRQLYGEDVDEHLYRSMIGSLMYLTSLRPDIMFAVYACARFQANPKSSHLHAVKRIFRYLKDRKSTAGGYRFLGCRLISWQCKKQDVVVDSTIEAEYIAASNCYGQVLWIQNQLLDYRYNFMQTKIHIDNESTICIVKNPVFHLNTNHIEIRHHFIIDSNEKKLIQMIKIHTYQNVADLLTKAFDVSRLQYLIASIRMLNL
ncbi:ribonuclease H-like domain-containing protein [Tanacetum coccineum]